MRKTECWNCKWLQDHNAANTICFDCAGRLGLQSLGEFDLSRGKPANKVRMPDFAYEKDMPGLHGLCGRWHVESLCPLEMPITVDDVLNAHDALENWHGGIDERSMR